MEITIEHVSLVFPIDLGVEGFRAIKRNDSLPQVKDTIADVKQLVLEIKLLPLFKQQVELDALEFNSLKLNTADFVHEARVKGSISRLYVKSHSIDWGKQTVNINDALLRDARVNVELSDTVPPDTTESKNYWKITVEKLDIARTGVTIHMPGDTLQIEAYMDKTEARNGYFDLYKGLYTVQCFDLNKGEIKYDNNFEPRIKGLDTNHISLSDIEIGIDSLSYCTPAFSMRLRECSFKEKSGITVESFTSYIGMDSTKVYLPDLYINTPDSYLKADFEMDLDAFDEKNPGKMYLTADCSIGKQDIVRFMGDMPTSAIRQLPNYPLTVNAVLDGNMKYLKLYGLNIKLPTAFNLNAKGYAANITDMDRLLADITFNANTYNMGFVSSFIGSNSISIPRGIGVKGNVKANGNIYSADLTANEGGGKVKANGKVNIKSMTYDARLDVENLNIDHYVPNNGMGVFTGNMVVNGTGTDFLSKKTKLTAEAGITKFNYDKYNLDGICFKAYITEGKAVADIDSDNPLLRGNIMLDAILDPKEINTKIIAELRHADWYGLHLVEKPLSTSLNCNVDINTNMQDRYIVDGEIKNITINDSSKTYTPDDLTVNLLTNKDTTHIAARCGDFRLLFNAKGGYEEIMNQGNSFTEMLSENMKNRKIDISSIREKLPLAELNLTTGKDNPLSRMLARAGYTFNEANVDVTTSPINGINGNMEIFALQNSAARLDTIYFNIASDSTHCLYDAQIKNGKGNQYIFNALLDGYVFEKGSGMNVSFYDAKDSLGLNLGIEASMEEDGIKVRMLTDDPILGYKRFDVNDDNYLYLLTNNRISANLKLQADDGTGVQIYTNDENTEALQDLTVALNRFDLEKVLSVIPYMPQVTGIMNGDFHVIQTPDELSVSSSLSVDSMTYERVKMGNLSTEFVYMPRNDGSHSVDATLSYNDEKVADISGTYTSEGDGVLDANMSMEHFPLRLLNGFMPDRIISLRGYADGQMAINGPLMRPNANGEIKLDSCYLRSFQYGVRMRFSEGPLRIVGSNILFEDFKMYASNDNQLVLDGNIDFSNLEDMKMDLRMGARNFQIIDSKENRRSIAYGKAFVDFFSRIKGSMSNLSMSGKLDVLGTTDMSYVLRDSPLSTNNQMDELVKFTSFTDTTATVVEHQSLSGFSMDLTMEIAQGAHVMCYLNDSHSNYIDLMGGGTLRMKYDAMNDLSLTGKYTLNNGEMKYSLPVIPLKTFTIQDGSYIEFTGDAMNPKLNITATERTKATVSSDNSSSGRSVEFDCGVVITKTLSDMGLEFTLDAPEDMTLHNELQAMGSAQRGKLAVTMLTTGMYLADGNTSSFSMNSALSSFLQSEINNITGSALKTLDLSFGMDNTTDESGNTQTDYSFKFAKRFWNNRVRIVVGGKVSTGSEVSNQNESFFDNVTLEYRLDNSSNKYVKVFYDNNAYDWLEGTTREYGVGFTWRRSLQHFKDIFKFNNNATQSMPAPADSTKKKQ
ncbi:MAG: translocation/assembly module TamB domain-containing protein [Prevotellaceae bacterium]|nr:translocation/assembly module TamB domain-containing protein [Prevotellaceae bacterium]